MGFVVYRSLRQNKPQAARGVAHFHKMAEKDFQKLSENEKDRIVNLAIPKTHKKRHSLG